MTPKRTANGSISRTGASSTEKPSIIETMTPVKRWSERNVKSASLNIAQVLTLINTYNVDDLWLLSGGVSGGHDCQRGDVRHSSEI